MTLPNDVGRGARREHANVWFFDGSPMGGTGEWKIAGQGIVCADGKTVRDADRHAASRASAACAA